MMPWVLGYFAVNYAGWPVGLVIVCALVVGPVAVVASLKLAVRCRLAQRVPDAAPVTF